MQALALLIPQAGSGDFSPVGAQSGGAIWPLLSLVGPLILALILLAFIARALANRHRYQAVNALSVTDREALRAAVTAAERRTVGEILPVVVERSDPHPSAEWLAALVSASLGSVLLLPSLPWGQPLLLLGVQLLTGALGFFLARRLPDLKHRLIFHDRACSVVEEQAFQEFYANHLHETEAATGVLLFVSLLEHRVVVMADRGINAKVKPGQWAEVDEAVLAGIRAGSLRDGLIAGVERAGKLLEKHFPWREGDRNEIPDRVIVRKE